MTEKDSYFQTRLSYEPERDAIWKVIVEYLQRYIPDQASVLELGAGYCTFINHVKAKSKHALDLSPIIKEYAAPDVETHIGNCVNLRQFKSNQFDVVFSSFLYEHLTRDELNKVMSQLRKILRPGGILLTLLPNFKYIARHYFDDYTHVQVFSHLSFADYVTSQNFTVTDVQGRFLPYTFKSRLPKSPLLTKLYLALPYRPMAGNMLVVAVNNKEKIATGSRDNDERQRSQRPQRPQRPQRLSRSQRPINSDDQGNNDRRCNERRDKTPPKVMDAEVEQKESSENDDEMISFTLQSQLPETGVRHGRKSRRSATAHYGVEFEELKPSEKPDGEVEEKNLTTFEIKAPEVSGGPIKPSEVRTRKKRKK